jgi:ribose transport system permease protein
MTNSDTKSTKVGDDSNSTLLLAPISWLERLRGGAREAGLAAVVVLLVIGFGIASPNFLSGGNLLAILLQASVVGILALGQTFVLITAGIDLSIGSIVAVSAICSASLALVMPVPLALLLGIVIGATAGLINGLLIMFTKITPFIVTLGTMSIYAGLALIISGGRAVYNVPQQYEDILSGHLAGIPIPIILVIVLTIIAALVLKYTRFGEYLIAVGGNKEVARLAGIRIMPVTVGAYVVSGAAAGLAGEVLVSRLGAADPTVGADLLLVAIAATVMGGTKLEGGEGTMIGALIGAILLAALTAGLTSLNVQAFYQQVAVGAAIIIALLVDQIARRQRRARKAF